VNAPSNTNGRVYERVQDAPEPVHVVALSGCHTLADKIRYACEHTRSNPTTATVRDWLARYDAGDPQPDLCVHHGERLAQGERPDRHRGPARAVG
jgi:hypothetical protein